MFTTIQFTVDIHLQGLSEWATVCIIHVVKKPLVMKTAYIYGRYASDAATAGCLAVSLILQGCTEELTHVSA